jgi:hypothetical protein
VSDLGSIPPSPPYLMLSHRKECCEVAQEEIKKALAAAEIDPSVLSPVVPKKAEAKAEHPVEAASGPRVGSSYPLSCPLMLL